MSLDQWRQWGWLKPHTPNRRDIEEQLKLAARERSDANVPGLSVDARFAHAYAAGLALARAALYAAGYEADKAHSGHKYSIDSLAFTVSATPAVLAQFDGFRIKRPKGMYDAVGAVSVGEAQAMLQIAEELSVSVPQWIRANHPKLLP